MDEAKGRIILYTGCMFSGKTNSLIQCYRDELARGANVIAFKPRTDTRGDPQKIISRTGEVIEAIPFSVTDQIIEVTDKCLEMLSPHVPVRVCVFIDEGQFVENLADAVRVLAWKVDCICIAGLSGDRCGLPWRSISELIPFCDAIEVLHARCSQCSSEATMTHLLESPRTEHQQILIDDGKRYRPLCLRCWEKFQRKK